MKKILIAEDDKFLANAYRVKIAKAGFDVRIASDGVEAMELVKSFLPDLVILDLVMPKKDGFSVLADLKNDPNYSKIPVIVASNLGQGEDVEKARKLGSNDYVVKTDLSLTKLIEQIRKIIGE